MRLTQWTLEFRLCHTQRLMLCWQVMRVYYPRGVVFYPRKWKWWRFQLEAFRAEYSTSPTTSAGAPTT